MNGNGADYDGTVGETENNQKCARWDEQPEDLITPELIHHNFCRNPDESDRPWCYIANGTYGERDYCEIQPCEEMEQLGFTYESAVTMHLDGTSLE